MDSIILNVEGMNCSNCERRVCKKLIGVKGIRAVRADSKAGTVQAVYDEKIAGMKEMMDSITEIGYFVV